MGKEEGHRDESLRPGCLSMRIHQPRVWQGIKAPAVLASGHHQKIAQWQLAELKEKRRNGAQTNNI